jgi:hypothetical protein
MIPEVQTALSPRDDQSLIPLMEEAGLDGAFLSFVALTEAPPDLNSGLLVAANLDKAFKTLPDYWQAAEAFCQWPELVASLLRQTKAICEQVGPQVDPVLRLMIWGSRRVCGQSRRIPEADGRGWHGKGR